MPHTTRLVLIGASNLTRGLAVVVETARSVLGGPLEIHAALGRGRSFCKWSRVFVRSLPGICDCGLWAALDARDSRGAPPPKTYALVTDIGNDVLYEQPLHRIVGHVEACADRLLARNASVIMTQLPIASVTALPRWGYHVAKFVTYRHCRLSHACAMEQTRELDARIARIAAERNLPLIELPRAWYGLDPIHIRRSAAAEAWRTIMRSWIAHPSAHEKTAAIDRAPLHRRLRYCVAMPERWRLLKSERATRQPAMVLPDGTTLHLY